MNALDNALSALEALDEGDFLMGGGVFLDKAFQEIEAAQLTAFQMRNVRDNRTNAGNRTPGGRVSGTKTAKKPRKPTAYQVWAKKERPKIVRQHPRFSFGRINKELGKRWKTASANPNRKKRGSRR